MASIDTLSDCEAWVKGKWQRVSVNHALKYAYPVVHCYKCHGRVVLMKESHDGRKGHAEHRPRGIRHADYSIEGIPRNAMRACACYPKLSAVRIISLW